jgi:putative flippase GtrA
VPHEEAWLTRVWRFGRALVVGSGATLVDFSIFTTCVRMIDVAPAHARLPALLAGACVQFVGSRGYTFRARAGRLSRQVKLFVAAEAVTLGLNWSVFQLLIRHVRGIAPELVSFLGTGLVFLIFAYPVRRLVIFKLPPELVRSEPPR